MLNKLNMTSMAEGRQSSKDCMAIGGTNTEKGFRQRAAKVQTSLRFSDLYYARTDISL